jgi:hypothetical protein
MFYPGRGQRCCSLPVIHTTPLKHLPPAGVAPLAAKNLNDVLVLSVSNGIGKKLDITSFTLTPWDATPFQDFQKLLIVKKLLG